MITTRSMTNKAAEAAKGHLALGLLNNASSKTGGTWEVYIYRAFEDKYILIRGKASLGKEATLFAHS